MHADEIITLLNTNWGWAAGLAASMFTLTVFAGAILRDDRKDELAIWLMGGTSMADWATQFNRLFDAVFGNRHWSLNCFMRSAVASLVAVVLIWLLVGGFGDLGLRIQADLSLRGVLAIALAVNIIADYLSLLETRFLLGQMHRLRSAWLQDGVLLIDLAISAAIITLAIFAYVNSPLYKGEGDSFGEILGVFSIFSVIFYSTFLTSVWSWAYVLTTWVMRLFRRNGLSSWLAVDTQPMRVLACLLGLIVFLGAMGISTAMQKDKNGISAVDRIICIALKDEACLKVAELTESEQAKLEFIMRACEGGITKECHRRGMETWEVKPEEAALLWAQACDGGNAASCSNLGYLYNEGLGVEKDLDAARRLYRLGCDDGDAGGCTILGYLYDEGHGVERDLGAARQLYRLGCDGGNPGGCTNLGYIFRHGLGVAQDLDSARQLYKLGCDGGNATGCTNLAQLYRQGLGVEKDLGAAQRLYRRGCDGGNALGCINLGNLYWLGTGVEQDLDSALQLFRKSCELGFNFACAWAGSLERQKN